MFLALWDRNSHISSDQTETQRNVLLGDMDVLVDRAGVRARSVWDTTLSFTEAENTVCPVRVPCSN